MFDARTYVDRRERLAAQFESGLVLFLGNDESPMNYADNPFHFRQDSTFLYYFGIDRPGFAALIDLDEGRTRVFADDLTIDDVVWTGPQPTVAQIAARGGVSLTAPLAALESDVARAQAQKRAIRFLPPYRAANSVRLLKLLGVTLDEQRERASVELIRAVVEMRAVKSAEEVAEIERAVDVTIDMHSAATRMARPGMKEVDIAAKVTEIALAAGGQLSFPVIATIHGETLHNHDYSHTLASGQMFLLDAGAETASHYAGDLTSAFPVDARFSQRQRDIYQLVRDTQAAAIAALRPGVPFREVHLLACRTLAAGLKGIGLMRGNIEDAVAQGAHALFFPYGVGHMLGLDVHDMEDLGEIWVGYEGQPKSAQFGLKSLRLARPLNPGFVFTVEPGVHFIPELIDRWRGEGKFAEFIDYNRVESYRDFGGIRLEDNLVVGAESCRVLGKQRPRTIAEVEAVRAQC
jgi:Xaa-Pro aminopeptidase